MFFFSVLRDREIKRGDIAWSVDSHQDKASSLVELTVEQSRKS